MNAHFVQITKSPRQLQVKNRRLTLRVCDVNTRRHLNVEVRPRWEEVPQELYSQSLSRVTRAAREREVLGSRHETQVSRSEFIRS